MGQRRWRGFAFGETLYPGIGRVPVEGLPAISIFRPPDSCRANCLRCHFVIFKIAVLVNPFMSCLDCLKCGAEVSVNASI
jgi:hypothetical protein